LNYINYPETFKWTWKKKDSREGKEKEPRHQTDSLDKLLRVKQGPEPINGLFCMNKNEMRKGPESLAKGKGEVSKVQDAIVGFGFGGTWHSKKNYSCGKKR